MSSQHLHLKCLKINILYFPPVDLVSDVTMSSGYMRMGGDVVQWLSKCFAYRRSSTESMQMVAVDGKDLSLKERRDATAQSRQYGAMAR